MKTALMSLILLMACGAKEPGIEKPVYFVNNEHASVHTLTLYKNQFAYAIQKSLSESASYYTGTYQPQPDGTAIVHIAEGDGPSIQLNGYDLGAPNANCSFTKGGGTVVFDCTGLAPITFGLQQR